MTERRSAAVIGTAKAEAAVIAMGRTRGSEIATPKSSCNCDWGEAEIAVIVTLKGGTPQLGYIHHQSRQIEVLSRMINTKYGVFKILSVVCVFW